MPLLAVIPEAGNDGEPRQQTVQHVCLPVVESEK